MRARRTDANHRAIVQALIQAGWLVQDTHTLKCFVDCVATRAGVVRLIEIKTVGGKYTQAQQFLLDMGWPITTLRSVDDAINLR